MEDLGEKSLKMFEKRRGGKKFFFLHGPPYVTNVLHVGNMRNYVYHDIVLRYKALRGFDVFVRPGLDCHGLPIEVKVEEKLGIKSKKEIEKMGIDKFVEECKKWVFEFGKTFPETYKKFLISYGWIPFENWYLTMRDEYIEKAWKAFKKAWEKGLVYEKEMPVWWCPRCETVLSNYEIADKYTDILDWSIFVKFPLKGEENTYLLVWTTTPWTLPGNVAIAVHPDEYYVKVEIDGEYLILAEKRLCELERIGKKYKIVEKFKGKELDGKEYEPVIDSEEQRKIKHRVVMSIPILKGYIGGKVLAKKEVEVREVFEHLVSMEEGTGLVHIAPAHGKEDYEIGKKYDLPKINVVDESGRMINAGKYNGLYFKDANKEIIKDLEEKGLLFHAEKKIHRYPLCWRCKTQLVFRLSKEFFFNIQKIKKKLVEDAEKIKFYPEHRKKQFIDWLLNAEDWPISRKRYWGIPIPLWVCKKCGRKIVIESKEELERLSGKKIKELHRPWVDVKIKCECGGEMERVPYVFDVWYDSGCASFASLSDEEFERYKFVDWICEGQDQIRGWFYTLHVVGEFMFERNVYESVCVVGWVLDEKGQKMSKSLGNVIYADEAVEKMGADQIRFYYCYSTPLSETMNFSLKEGKRIGDQVINILLNTVKFYRDYLKRASFDGEERFEDKWIKEYCKKVVKEVTEAFDNFDFKKAAELLRDLIVEKISRTYVKMIRDRVRKGEKKPLEVLGEVLLKAVIMLSPIMPKTCEEAYQLLKETGICKEDSVFFENWPETEDYDEEIIEEMEKILEIVKEALSLREKEKIKWRWPVKEIVIEKEVKDPELLRKMVNAVKIRVGEIPENYLIGETSYMKFGISREIDKDRAILNEVCRRIQEVRKKKGYKVYQMAKLIISENMRDFVEKFKDEIMERCNLEKIEYGRGEEKILIEDFGIEFEVSIE